MKQPGNRTRRTQPARGLRATLGLGGWKVERDRRASSRRPWPTRLANACGAVVAVVRDEAAAPLAPETTDPRSSNCPVHGETGLDTRGSELTSRFLRAGRKHDPASGEGVTRVQRAALRNRPYANCYAVSRHGTSLPRPLSRVQTAPALRTLPWQISREGEPSNRALEDEHARCVGQSQRSVHDAA